MIFFVAVNFLSALWFAWRIFASRERRRFKLVGFLVVVMVAVIMLVSGWWAICLNLILPVAEKVLKVIESRVDERLAREQLRRVVERTVVEMRIGRAFRPALKSAVQGLPDGLLARRLRGWLATHDSVAVRDGEPWWRAIAEELARCDQQAHQSLARAAAWRARLRAEFAVERRLGQVLTQVRLQGALVGVLYLGLFILAVTQGWLLRNPALSLFSLLLFILGEALIFRLGRAIKWNF